MATFDSREQIALIIKGNGWQDPSWEAEGEPPAVKVVEYTNAWGRRAWGVVFANETPSQQLRYETPTEYVRDPKVIWRREVQ